jgi:uncharacterized membrane protein (DUF2068 family)
MSATPPKTGNKPKRAPTLYFIVLHHLAKGALLLLASVGIFALNRSGHDLGGVFDQVLRFVHLDPAQRFFMNIDDWLDTVTPASMRKAELGTMLYGLVLTGAGVGLAFRAHWGVWLAIGEAAFFIPIEIYELVRHLSTRPPLIPPRHDMFAHPVAGLLVVLAINVLVVLYLSVNRHRIFKH